MAILSFIRSKIDRIFTICENYHLYLTQCVRSAPKYFGGDQWLNWGIKDVLNERYARTTARNQGLNPFKKRIQNEKK